MRYALTILFVPVLLLHCGDSMTEAPADAATSAADVPATPDLGADLTAEPDVAPDVATPPDTATEDTLTEDTALDEVAETADVQACPPPPTGCDGLHVPTDLDADGCPDTCCVQECPPDFVVADIDKDGCGDSCGDAPCHSAKDCSVYACAFYEGQCDSPKGICSNAACNLAGPVCGCDGVTYETGCAANALGVPVAKAEACAVGPCDAPTSSSTLSNVTIAVVQATQCLFTLAEAAAGIEIPYAIYIDKDIPDVVVKTGGGGSCAQPGESGLIVFEQLDGGEQSYCICDAGKCAPPAEVPVTLKAGTYLGKFAWDGKNWFGPSDFGNPKGPPFPAGKYTLHLTAIGTASGQDFEVKATLPVTLVP